MNKEDVIKTVSEKTGVAPDAIEKVVKAFESQAGDALTVAFEGIKTDRTSLLAGISQKTGIPVDTCDKVLTALQGTVSSGISEKLGFLEGAVLAITVIPRRVVSALFSFTDWSWPGLTRPSRLCGTAVHYDRGSPGQAQR